MRKLADISAFESLSLSNSQSITNGVFDSVRGAVDKLGEKVVGYVTDKVDAARERRSQRILDQRRAKLNAIAEQQMARAARAQELDQEAEQKVRDVVEMYAKKVSRVRHIEAIPKPEMPWDASVILDGLWTERQELPGASFSYKNEAWSRMRRIAKAKQEEILGQWNVDYADTQYNPVADGLGRLLRKIRTPKK